MRIPAHLLGLSLLSAAGALPVLFLPALVAAHGVLFDGSTGFIALLGGAVLIGEFLSSFAAPILIGDRIGRKTTLPMSLLLVLSLLGGTFTGGAISVAFWLGAGFFGGVLQYVGTLGAILEPNPVRASNLRLSVSMVVSGGSLLLASFLGATNPERSIWAITVITVLALVAGNFLTAPGRVSTDEDDTATQAGAGPFYVVLAFACVAWFFGVFIAFVSFLPLTAQGNTTGDIVAAMALGKILGAPGLFLIASLRSRAVGRTLGPAVISAALFAASLAALNYPFVIAFIALELSLNAAAGTILGKTSEKLSERQRQWVFSSIQIGAAIGFLTIEREWGETLNVPLPILIYSAAVLPFIWAYARR